MTGKSESLQIYLSKRANYVHRSDRRNNATPTQLNVQKSSPGCRSRSRTSMPSVRTTTAGSWSRPSDLYFVSACFRVLQPRWGGKAGRTSIANTCGSPRIREVASQTQSLSCHFSSHGLPSRCIAPFLPNAFNCFRFKSSIIHS